MKRCAECDVILTGDPRVMSRKRFCSVDCKSKNRTTSGARKNGHLWSTFRIREEQYNKLMISQDFKCAICEIHQSECSRNFAVDHDHNCCNGRKSCGKCIRGLLCFECNIGLGKFKDSEYLLSRARDYIQTYSK